MEKSGVLLGIFGGGGYHLVPQVLTIFQDKICFPNLVDSVVRALKNWGLMFSLSMVANLTQ